MNSGSNTISQLHPKDRQTNFIYFIDDLESSIEVMKYLVDFGKNQRPFTPEEEIRLGELEDCSLRVRYLFSKNHGKRVSIRINCESQLVQGVLAIFADIYQGCCEKEIREVPPVFQRYLPQGLCPSFERKDGVKRLYYRLIEFSRSW